MSRNRGKGSCGALGKCFGHIFCCVPCRRARTNSSDARDVPAPNANAKDTCWKKFWRSVSCGLCFKKPQTEDAVNHGSSLVNQQGQQGPQVNTAGQTSQVNASGHTSEAQSQN